jgi:hypothetical protein
LYGPAAVGVPEIVMLGPVVPLIERPFGSDPVTTFHVRVPDPPEAVHAVE